MNRRRSTAAAGGQVERPRPSGATLVEIMAAVAVTALLAAMTVPALASGRDQFRTAGAARHLTALVYSVRTLAIRRNGHVALRFSDTGPAPALAVFADGNGNGVRSADITRGTDVRLGADFRLADQFPGVEFGLVPGVGDIDTGAPLSGSGVRIGTAGLVSFAPGGSCTSGTLYVRGRGQHQYAVRLLGATGRVRVLRFNRDTKLWDLP